MVADAVEGEDCGKAEVAFMVVVAGEAEVFAGAGDGGAWPTAGGVAVVDALLYRIGSNAELGLAGGRAKGRLLDVLRLRLRGVEVEMLPQGGRSVGWILRLRSAERSWAFWVGSMLAGVG